MKKGKAKEPARAAQKTQAYLRGYGVERALEELRFCGKVWIGVDPGSSSGGIAIVAWDGTSCRLFAFPTRHLEYSDRFRLVRAVSPWLQASALEHVWATPKAGVTSSFHFGVDVGAWRQVLQIFEAPLFEVNPKQWQAELELPNLEREALLRGIALERKDATEGRLTDNKLYALRKTLLGEEAQRLAPPELFLFGKCASYSYDAILIARHLFHSMTGKKEFR